MAKSKKMNGHTRKKQQTIPGTERPDDLDDVDDAIAEYLETKAKRKELQSSEPSLLAAIQSLLQANKRKRYVYVDGEFTFTCTLEGQTKLRWRRERIKAEPDVTTDEREEADEETGRAEA